MRRVVMSLFLALVLFLFFELPASASSTMQSVQLVNKTNPTGGIEDGAYVYFGSDKNDAISFDACWRVLDASYANNGQAGLFLLTRNLVGNLNDYNGGIVFDQNGFGNVSTSRLENWKESDARKWCQSFAVSSFSRGEQGAMLAVTKTDESYIHGSGEDESTFVKVRNSLENDKVFFLSAEEAADRFYGFTSDASRVGKFNGRASWWWLRSTSLDSNNKILAGAVSQYGEILTRNIREESAVRPALNLNYSKIVFTSAAKGGKSFSPTGSQALSKIPDYYGEEWKLTVSDSDHSQFKATRQSMANGIITVRYSGAQTGSNEYISAIITRDNGNILYYGKIAKVSSSGGTVKIDVNDRVYSGCRLYVFQEQINGDNTTDYCGDLIELSLKTDIAVPKAVGGLIYNGTAQTGVPAGDGYFISNNKRVEAGSYKAVCTLRSPDTQQWSDGSISSKTISWSIEEAPVDKLVISGLSDKTYTGSEVMQDLMVSLGALTLKEGIDYDISYTNNKSPGTAVLTITGRGNIKGTKTYQFMIKNSPAAASTGSGDQTRPVSPKSPGENKSASDIVPLASSPSEVIARMKSDEAPKGSLFHVLALRSTKQKKHSVTLRWKKVSGAVRYVVYGNKCGKKNRMRKIKTIKGRKIKIKKIKNKKLKKGTYYKFLVMALDQKGQVLSISKTTHVATKGGRAANILAVAFPTKVNILLADKGGVYPIGARYFIPESSGQRVKIHRQVQFESGNNSIASVSKRGVLRTKAAGSCYIYAYAQNGIYAKIMLRVK